MTGATQVARQEVTLQAGGVSLKGLLTVPGAAGGIILFAHGSGSSRFSPRNRFVASYLNAGELGTLLFDLLTSGEYAEDQITAELRFDIALLSRRLIAAVDWVSGEASLARLRIGLFGASTGAAAALNAAAERPQRVACVVSRGGRPDLAMQSLPLVRAPTLMIVGALDAAVIEYNRAAARQLTAEHAVEIVPGATHLFEEPGTLEEVARLARDWFRAHLR